MRTLTSIAFFVLLGVGMPTAVAGPSDSAVGAVSSRGLPGSWQVAGLRCEWRVNPQDVPDPCPEFFWEMPTQSAYRLTIAQTQANLAAGKRLLWDSGRIDTPLPIAEYAGPPLDNGTTYYWTVRVWDADAEPLPLAPTQTFRMMVHPMPHHLPTIRTFINFAGNAQFARDWLDLSFRKEAKELRDSVLATRYGLICTLVLPHPSTGLPLADKAAALAEFCVSKGLTKQGILEEMFCHFSEDTRVTLHVGAERAANPRETRLCPGWDPANDRNGDGRVDDEEAARLANPKATAREPRQARIPIYFWGPPRDDFVMNVGHPAYQEFMATVWAQKLCAGYDGIYFDTVPPDVAGAGRSASVLEYPRTGGRRGQWLRDLQMMFARIKIAMPDKMITGNAWDANPMVNDGRQSEGWMAIDRQLGRWRESLDHAIELDRRGKIQLIQYNPIFHPELAEFGPKLPVSQDRDKMFGLATYLLAHGRFTYFGFGRHPYAEVTKLWFNAMRHDLGEPAGDYDLFDRVDAANLPGATNLLPNGDFERADANSNPAEWTVAEPVELDTNLKRSGSSAVKITSDDPRINNINKLSLRLKPHTSYTLIAWARCDGVKGQPGAQVYPYEFDDADAQGMLTWSGTHDWSEQRLVFRTGDDVEGRINFRIYGATGTVWFDDIRLVEGVAAKQEVFSREYTKGLVLVKPYVGGSFGEETATTHTLPGTFRPLNVDGTLGRPVQQVTLRNAEAAILVKHDGWKAALPPRRRP